MKAVLMLVSLFAFASVAYATPVQDDQKLLKKKDVHAPVKVAKTCEWWILIDRGFKRKDILEAAKRHKGHLVRNDPRFSFLSGGWYAAMRGPYKVKSRAVSAKARLGIPGRVFNECDDKYLQPLKG